MSGAAEELFASWYTEPALRDYAGEEYCKRRSDQIVHFLQQMSSESASEDTAPEGGNLAVKDDDEGPPATGADHAGRDLRFMHSVELGDALQANVV